MTPRRNRKPKRRRRRWRPPRCCGKTPYATQAVAEAVIDRIAFIADGRRPVRAYQCPRGWWHLTSRPTWTPAPRWKKEGP